MIFMHSVTVTKVIPLTTSLGMIEWLEDMPVLREFLEDNINEKVNCFEEASEKYKSWITKASSKKNKSDLEAYASALHKYSKEATITNYLSLVNSLPLHTLRYVCTIFKYLNVTLSSITSKIAC